MCGFGWGCEKPDQKGFVLPVRWFPQGVERNQVQRRRLVIPHSLWDKAKQFQPLAEHHGSRHIIKVGKTEKSGSVNYKLVIF